MCSQARSASDRQGYCPGAQRDAHSRQCIGVAPLVSLAFSLRAMVVVSLYFGIVVIPAIAQGEASKEDATGRNVIEELRVQEAALAERAKQIERDVAQVEADRTAARQSLIQMHGEMSKGRVEAAKSDEELVELHTQIMDMRRELKTLEAEYKARVDALPGFKERVDDERQQIEQVTGLDKRRRELRKNRHEAHKDLKDLREKIRNEEARMAEASTDE